MLIRQIARKKMFIKDFFNAIIAFETLIDFVCLNGLIEID
jgi:hypothetical protein